MLPRCLERICLVSFGVGGIFHTTAWQASVPRINHFFFFSQPLKTPATAFPNSRLCGPASCSIQTGIQLLSSEWNWPYMLQALTISIAPPFPISQANQQIHLRFSLPETQETLCLSFSLFVREGVQPRPQRFPNWTVLSRCG